VSRLEDIACAGAPRTWGVVAFLVTALLLGLGESDRGWSAEPPVKFAKFCTPGDVGFECGGPLARFGCDLFLSAPEPLGQLEPALPLLTCVRREQRGAESERGVARIQGRGWARAWISVHSYVAFADGDFILLDSPEDFRALFAPVTSANEALAFAVAMRLGEPVRNPSDLRNLEGGVYIINRSDIAPTTVEARADGFMVTVYSVWDPCAEMVTQRHAFVGRDGRVEVRESVPVWRRTAAPCIE
jgi:hypothetical protein